MIENEVCSLENAKKLAELGVVRESLFFWELNKANKYFPGRVTFGDPSVDNSWSIPYPAYTVAELGRMLPDVIRGYKQLTIRKFGEEFEISYPHNVGFLNESLKESMSIMLIWLIKNKHVDVKELNR